MRALFTNYRVAAALVKVVLAALCIEHGLEIVSNDSDFARSTKSV